MIRKTPPHHILVGRVREVLRFERFYERRLRGAGKAMRVNEVNPAELGILLELLPGPCTPGWLCWRLGQDPAYVSRSLKRLELDECVKLHESEGDRRSRQASLTDRGLAAARSLAQFQESAVWEMLEDLPARQQRRLVRAMNAIIEIFERDALTNLMERHDPRGR